MSRSETHMQHDSMRIDPKNEQDHLSDDSTEVDMV